MKFCPFCGAEMPEILTLCPACGKETPQAPAGSTENSWDEISKRFALEGGKKGRAVLHTSPLETAGDPHSEDGVLTPILGSRFGLARPEDHVPRPPAGTVVDVMLPASMSEISQSHDTVDPPPEPPDAPPPPPPAEPPLDHHDETTGNAMPLPTPPQGSPKMLHTALIDRSQDGPTVTPTPPSPKPTNDAPKKGKVGLLFALTAASVGFLVMVGAGSLAWFYFTSPEPERTAVTDADAAIEDPAGAVEDRKKVRKKRPKKQTPKTSKEGDKKTSRSSSKPESEEADDTPGEADDSGKVAPERPKIFAAGLVDVRGFEAERLRGFVHNTDLVPEPTIGTWAVVQLAGIDAVVVPNIEGNNPPVQAALIATELIKIVEAHRDNNGGAFEAFPTGPTIQIVWRKGELSVPLLSVEEKELGALVLFDDPVPGNLDRARHLARWLTVLLNAVVLGEVPESLDEEAAKASLETFVSTEGEVAERAAKLSDEALGALNRLAFVTPK